MPYKKDTKAYEVYKKRAADKQRKLRLMQQQLMRELEADIGMVHSKKEDNGFRRVK